MQSDSNGEKDKYQELIKTTKSPTQDEPPDILDHKLQTVEERIRETSHSERCHVYVVNLISVVLFYYLIV